MSLEKRLIDPLDFIAQVIRPFQFQVVTFAGIVPLMYAFSMYVCMHVFFLIL